MSPKLDFRLPWPLQGLEPVVISKPSELHQGIPHFPPEIISLIAENFEKWQLESVQTVREQWDVIAVPFLFDQICISLHEKISE